MAQKKILEIGTEGGSATFLLTRVNGREKVMISATVNDMETGDISSHNNVFNSLEEAVSTFARRNNRLLYFHPLYVHPAYATALAVYLNRELRTIPAEDREHLHNKEDWERMLNISITIATDTQIQQFELLPVEKIQTYSYNHYAGEKELQHIRTTFNYEPDHRECLEGFGEVTESVFIIRDPGGRIKGVFPLDQYRVKIIEG